VTARRPPVVTFAVQIARGCQPLAGAVLVAANLVLRRNTGAPQVTDHIPVSPAALLPAVAARR
jgi:hypothetical protein